MINKSLIALMIMALAQLPIETASTLGPNGHRIVAKIADDNVESSAKKALMEITNDEPLAKLANITLNSPFELKVLVAFFTVFSK